MTVGIEQVTVAEFDRFVEQPENADKLFEYIGGEIVEVPSNPYVSHIASRINRRLGNFVEDRDLGYITDGQGGYTVSGERYAPDVAYLAKKNGPLAAKGYNPNPPDLAVEVLSSARDRDLVRLKIANYLAAGTLTWSIYSPCSLAQYEPEGKDKKAQGQGGVERVNWWYGRTTRNPTPTKQR